ncbi:MAG: hypothetical protein DRO88_14200 [Promethearchaeia archaeon]|nr:MAG: hypothetical protein DRO88_14200 [Candidatus Lokiarchaeia archaeon]
MTKTSNKIILALVLLGILGALGIMGNYSNPTNNQTKKMLKTNTMGVIEPSFAAAHSPIFIDGNDPAHDWDDCDAVTGSGTFAYPYVIENLEIDAGGAGSGIYIRDSSAYLKIKNCIIINTGTDFPNS